MSKTRHSPKTRMEHDEKGGKTVHSAIEEHFAQDRSRWDRVAKQDFYARLGRYLLYEKHHRLDSRLKAAKIDEDLMARIRNAGDHHSKNDERARSARTAVAFIRAAVLHGVPVRFFGLLESDVYPNGLTHQEPGFFSFDYGQNMEEDYFSFMNAHIKEGIEELHVYDYLGRGVRDDPNRDLGEYFKACGRMYSQIEEKLREDGLKYTRVLGLHIKSEVPNTFPEASEAILQECSPELFQHMCACFKEFEPGRAQFFITSKAIRTYQFAILKKHNGVRIYEELYRLDQEGDAYPTFSTMKPSMEKKDMHRHYYKELRELTWKREDMRFSRKSFCECFSRIAARLAEEDTVAEGTAMGGEVRAEMEQKLEIFKSFFGEGS